MAEMRNPSVLGPIRLIVASSTRRRALAAFVILYAWEYLAFFSSALTKGSPVLSPSLPEQCWCAAGLALTVSATGLLVRRRSRPLRFSRRVYLLAAVLMGACCLGIWMLHTYNVLPDVLPFACAALIGLLLPLMYLYRIDHFPELEASFLGTFFGLVSVFSLLVYLVFIMLPTGCAVAFCTVAPLAFALMSSDLPDLERRPAGAERSAPSKLIERDAPFSVKPMLLNYASAFIFIVWLNFAFFRVIAAPWDFESRSWYSPSVFVTTLLVTLALFLIIRKTATRTHQRGQARFAIVVFAVSYLILYVRFYSPLLATIAFSFCFACMIALEALAWSFWYQAVKQDRRFASVPLLIYLMAKGAGIFAGVMLGEQSCLITNGVIPVTAPLFFLVVLFACGMAIKLEDFDKLFIGGDARPLQGYETDFGRLVIADAIESAAEGPTASAPPSPAPPAPPRAESAADALAERFALSPRETDVARLLLAGRNRPYIKDALFISAGTVNSHISSIYRKTEVNSQQDLISLAEAIGGEALPRTDA